MKVWKYPNQLKIKSSSLIMGCFEVIHNGHLKLIQEAKRYSDPVVIMLIENPACLPKSMTKKATDLDVRLEQLANLGVHHVIVIDVNAQIQMIEGHDFVKQMLKLTSAKRIIVGRDFKAGQNAKYTSKIMAKDFNNVVIINFVKFGDTKISSSLIKELLETGDVDVIKQMSPFPFQMKLNFNAQLCTNDISNYSLIHAGIYACYCEVNEIIYWSLFHVNLDHNKGAIYVPDLNIMNHPFTAKLWLHKKIRTITKTDDDYVTNHDKEIAAAYLINL